MRKYQVWIENVMVGTTDLEDADPPMGCVSGKIHPLIDYLNYDFIKTFYSSHNIEFSDYPEDKLISTRATNKLKVVTPNGITIESLGNQIEGCDNDGYHINLEGIAYPFYEVEFPHHVEVYFKKNE